MLTGRRAFQRESAVETMNAILREEPPELETASGKIAPRLDLILRRCLAKRPEQWFQSASDLGFALEALGSSPTVSGERNVVSRRAGRERLLWMAALALVALLPFVVAYLRRAPDPVQTTRSSIRGGQSYLHRKRASGAGDEEALWQSDRPVYPYDWSKDGRFILFLTGGQQTRADLWVLPLGDRKPFPVLNSQFSEMDGAFSPDGRWIAYVSDETGTEQVYV
ncbi:MAG: hypothetical protein ACREEM_11155, partial [Blastocatellia bacterium]